jgi:hypothetical protein
MDICVLAIPYETGRALLSPLLSYIRKADECTEKLKYFSEEIVIHIFYHRTARKL